MSARKNMQACFVLPEHCMAGLVESNSSARAIRKTALRAYCGCRHCFTHKKALSTYRCPLAKTCKHVLCFPNTVWQAWLRATVPPAPFVKPHCVLIVAAATVLLIKRRSAHTDVRLQKHAGMFSASRTSVWLNCYNKKCEEHKNG